jgi:hypothetical protein
MLVRPLRRNMHVNKKPSPVGTPLATFEGRIKVTIPTIATQQQPDPGIHSFIISGGVIEIPEHASVWSNPKPAFTQDSEAA